MSDPDAFVIHVRRWASDPAKFPDQAWIAFSEADGASHLKGTGRTAFDAVRDWLQRNKRAYVMSDEPLHVRVAEALGCHPVHDEYYGWSCTCPDGIGVAPHCGYPESTLLRYDTDWSATGPLIEKYGIDVWVWRASSWRAATDDCDGARSIIYEDGSTPLIAVCNLILALKAAGKLA